MNDEGEDSFFEKVKEELEEETIEEETDSVGMWDILGELGEEIVDELNDIQCQRTLVKIGLWQIEQENDNFQQLEKLIQGQEKLQVMLEHMFRKYSSEAWWEWSQR